VHTMGLSPKLAFHDVISISEPELLSFLPRPVEALLLIFPVTNVYEDYRVNADKDKELYLGENPVDGDVMWFRQTIGNACGTMGVIHSVFNGNVPSYLRMLSEIPVLLTSEPNTPFANIFDKAKTMNTAQRAELLEESPDLEAAHTSFSREGQTQAPRLDEEVEHHYVALVKHRDPKTGNLMLYELDGRRLGPVERGNLPDDEDLVGPTALKVMDEFITREQENGKFSLVALAPSYD